MGGANWTGGRMNLAKARSKDTENRLEKKHFANRSLRLAPSSLRPAASNPGTIRDGINLAAARRERQLTNHEYHNVVRKETANETWPADGGYRKPPSSTTSTDSRSSNSKRRVVHSKVLDALDEQTVSHAELRRRILKAQDLAGLTTEPKSQRSPSNCATSRMALDTRFDGPAVGTRTQTSSSPRPFPMTLSTRPDAPARQSASLQSHGTMSDRTAVGSDSNCSDISDERNVPTRSPVAQGTLLAATSHSRTSMSVELDSTPHLSSSRPPSILASPDGPVLLQPKPMRAQAIGLRRMRELEDTANAQLSGTTKRLTDSTRDDVCVRKSEFRTHSSSPSSGGDSSESLSNLLLTHNPWDGFARELGLSPPRFKPQLPWCLPDLPENWLPENAGVDLRLLLEANQVRKRLPELAFDDELEAIRASTLNSYDAEATAPGGLDSAGYHGDPDTEMTWVGDAEILQPTNTEYDCHPAPSEGREDYIMDQALFTEIFGDVDNVSLGNGLQFDRGSDFDALLQELDELSTVRDRPAPYDTCASHW
ncbi:hypothetical protein DACRYDRAFT_107558 [Dacryopinax primogenitus]|uniref:Uncharacterized protein n=1 Tax=Dacryopinax primogenitus (strain DJM 731) TaxID=1858805 RepID=M5G101_DACPD|nr:uncharacterized protein DACRYDRAFT_107558 [Dacryopinax primogenitus]EJU01825.1 hypothetical protein DACRYDRAFT_107558 [Dacryopinax primogenitus]